MYSIGFAWFLKICVWALSGWFGFINCNPIVGGHFVQESEISRYSFVASLQDRYPFENGTSNFKHFCGGSLISSSWILTAAHCVYNKRAENIVAAIGYRRLKADDLNYQLVDTIKVINFVSLGLKNDIALVRLKSSVVMTESRYLEIIPERGVKASRKRPCKVVGYGADKYGGSIQDNLKEGEVFLISQKRCTQILGKIMAPQDGDNSVCALGNSEDSCQGDSGGPLICKVNGRNYIFGIVSHGLKCGQPGVPSIYTVTIPYKKWIEDVINKNETND